MQGDMAEYLKCMSSGRSYRKDEVNLLDLAVESNSVNMAKQVHKDFPEYPFTPKAFHSAIVDQNAEMLNFLMDTCPPEKWASSLFLSVQLHPSNQLMNVLHKHGYFDGIDVFHICFGMVLWSFCTIVWLDHRFEIGYCDQTPWCPLECPNEDSYFYLVSKGHKDFWTTQDGDCVLDALDTLYIHGSPCPLMDPRANLAN